VLTLVEKVLILAEVPLLRRIGTADLAPLAQAARGVDLEKGELLYQVGDASDALRVVVKGRVQLTRERQSIDLTAGECFGAWALLDTQPRYFTATVVERSLLLELDRDAFVDVMADHVNVARGVLAELAARRRLLPAPTEDTELG
jgi:CRP-like cAMP-binding protein